MVLGEQTLAFGSRLFILGPSLFFVQVQHTHAQGVLRRNFLAHWVRLETVRKGGSLLDNVVEKYKA